MMLIWGNLDLSRQLALHEKNSDSQVFILCERGL